MEGRRALKLKGDMKNTVQSWFHFNVSVLTTELSRKSQERLAPEEDDKRHFGAKNKNLH